MPRKQSANVFKAHYSRPAELELEWTLELSTPEVISLAHEMGGAECYAICSAVLQTMELRHG
jgi:hypothetical protein